MKRSAKPSQNPENTNAARFDVPMKAFDPQFLDNRPHLMIERFGAQLVSSLTINQLVDEKPTRARFFETLHLNYCCSGGDKSFGRACAERGLNTQNVLNELLDYDKNTGSVEATPNESLRAMLEHIAQKHHGELRRDVPRLKGLLARVSDNHGHLFHELWEIEGAFEELSEQLLSRIKRHETQLFPMCRQLAEQHADGSPQTFGREAHFVQWRLGRMIETSQTERVWLSEALEQINGWAARLEDAHSVCTRLRVAISSLREFEAQLQQLFHDENLLLSRLTTLDEARVDHRKQFAPTWMQNGN